MLRIREWNMTTRTTAKFPTRNDQSFYVIPAKDPAIFLGYEAISFLAENIWRLTKGAKDEDDSVEKNKKCSNVKDIKYVLVLVKGQEAFGEGVVSCHGMGIQVSTMYGEGLLDFKCFHSLVHLW